MSKKATELQRKEMSKMYRGTEIFNPLNTGYNDLKDPSVSGFFRFLSKVGDGMMKMQIVKLSF